VLPRARVRLDGVPVALFLAAEQHQNDLLREIALMAVATTGHESGHRYADLLAAADRYAHRPAAIRRPANVGINVQCSRARTIGSICTMRASGSEDGPTRLPTAKAARPIDRFWTGPPARQTRK